MIEVPQSEGISENINLGQYDNKLAIKYEHIDKDNPVIEEITSKHEGHIDKIEHKSLKNKNKIEEDIFKFLHFKKFKEDLFEIINNEISKVSVEMQKLLSDKGYLEDLLKVGAEEAREIANKNIREIKKIINFYNL